MSLDNPSIDDDAFFYGRNDASTDDMIDMQDIDLHEGTTNSHHHHHHHHHLASEEVHDTNNPNDQYQSHDAMEGSNPASVTDKNPTFMPSDPKHQKQQQQQQQQSSPHPQESSELDTLTQNAALLMEKKLDSTKAWAQRLVQEITIYVQTMEEVHADYLQVQAAELEESARLDQLEPDVQGATFNLVDVASQYLGRTNQQDHNDPHYNKAGMQTLNLNHNHRHS